MQLWSQLILTDDNSLKIKPIGKEIHYFEDPDQLFVIEEILSDSIQSKFKKGIRDSPNFSSTSSAMWLKLKVENFTNETYYLEIGTAFMDSIALYEFDKNGDLISTRYSGDDFPYDHREIMVGNYLFELNLPKNNTKTYYLRIESVQPLFFPLRVGTLNSFISYNHDFDFIQGIYFGFMLLIFLYNLFLFFSIKDSIYLYYIAYIFSMTWFMASVYGYFFEYFWPDTPWINQYVVITSGFTMITATLFTQKFLDLKKRNVRLFNGASFFAVIGLLVIVLVGIDLKIIGLQVAQGSMLLMSVYFLYLGISFKIRGYTEAKYYLIAWGVLLTGIVVALLESMNIIPVMQYLNAMQIGSGLEAMLLSFALGHKINVYKKQKEEAMALALKSAKENELLIKEQNVMLESQVLKRTKEIASQNKELIDINEEKNNLISIVAHDLSSPLNQLKGFIQIIRLNKEPVSKESQEILNLMHQSTDRLTQMIRRILDVNAIESKKIQLSLSKVDLNKVVKQVVLNFQLDAKEKTISIQTEIDSNKNYEMEIDENYLIQVIENLISNALKFSPKKSEIKVNLERDNESVFIHIIDNGPGISKDDQEQLFKRYQKLSAQPTAGESSTGLGLYIAKKYMDAMGGEIYCESKPGHGSKFTLAFKSGN